MKESNLGSTIADNGKVCLTIILSFAGEVDSTNFESSTLQKGSSRHYANGGRIEMQICEFYAGKGGSKSVQITPPENDFSRLHIGDSGATDGPVIMREEN